jgi:hypothetical protein
VSGNGWKLVPSWSRQTGTMKIIPHVQVYTVGFTVIANSVCHHIFYTAFLITCFRCLPWRRMFYDSHFQILTASVSSNFVSYFNSFPKVKIIFQCICDDTYLQSVWHFWHPCLLIADLLQAIQHGMRRHDHVKPLLSTELPAAESVDKVRNNTVIVYLQYVQHTAHCRSSGMYDSWVYL